MPRDRGPGLQHHTISCGRGNLEERDVDHLSWKRRTVMKMRLDRVSCIVGLLLLFGPAAHAQLKARYINSTRILQEYEGAQAIQRQIDDLKRSYEDEFQAMQDRLKQQMEEYQNRSLPLSQEKSIEKENELSQGQAALEQYYYSKLGPQGEYYQKSQQIQEPLIQKINATIASLSERNGYDLVLDADSGAVAYGKKEFDISDEILKELRNSR
jgi:Skp family chaperone for outer membrane proteins